MRIPTHLTRFILQCMVIAVIFIFAGNAMAQDKGTFTDPRDGHTYNWQKFGKQVWMTENLNYKTATGSWTYKNDTANGRFYGRLYDWNTALKACPKGWHLPTDLEWGTFMTSLGGDDIAAVKLEKIDSAYISTSPKVADNFKNFITLMGGVKHDTTFAGVGQWGGFWSATAPAKDKDEAVNFLFAHGAKGVGKSTNSKGAGFSVRCVRNK
jgi:uncharacterized protein (TIGR02145 family)